MWNKRVACNIMIMSEPVNYIRGLNLENNEVDRIMKSVKKIKEIIKVA